MDGTEILAVAVYVPLIVAAAVAVWRRPVLALYLFVFGLAVHNIVMASLYEAGVRGLTLDAIAAWKEILLAVALLAVCVRARGLPFRPQLVDALALAFAVVVVVYAVLPQSVLDGEASAEGVLQGLRHAIVPVLAYALGRSLGLGARELRRLGYAVVGVAALLAVGGIVELYAVPLDWWRESGAPGWYRDQLGFDYDGPSGLPENFVFNLGEGEYARRLVSSFLSPLASGYVLAVALLFVAAFPTFATIAAAPSAARGAPADAFPLDARRARRRPGRARAREASLVACDRGAHPRRGRGGVRRQLRRGRARGEVHGRRTSGWSRAARARRRPARR